ncbi:hypothetical protein [Streptomyces sp. ISL-11]|uniref:hypothetical protein n=1 Tax=Streptomyces sp. ISL-11 TaxID=2819174 RepID=UPI001BEC457B|nr:hypothetical protein [Streptomyces sp. ISL-11]MBT2385236.1 hypothetical protein [Streptomyces sp. ISL-11]
MGEADLKVITDGLRTDAGMWDKQSSAMGEIGRKVDGMRISRLEAGLFQVIYSAYESAINQVSARCGEGEKRMAEVADALVKNAKAYDNHEADTKKHVAGAY